jgi:hypothetical protein
MRDPEDKKAFAEAFQMLAAVYRQEVTKPLMAGYWAALQDLPIETVQGVIVDALRNGGEFMPPPGVLRPKSKPEFVAPYHKPWIRPKEWGPSVLDEKLQWKQLAEALKPEGEES